MNKKERLVDALVDFYRKIASGLRPTEMLILRISKENKIEKPVLVQYINKINKRLVSERIDNSWNIEEKIKEIVDPTASKVNNYISALKEISQIAPDITTFEVEKVIIKYDLDEKQKEKLRNEAQKLRGDIYRDVSSKKNKLEQAKKKIRREFLKDPNCITRSKIDKIAQDHGVMSGKLVNFYKENYKEWTEIRAKANTIEEIIR